MKKDFLGHLTKVLNKENAERNDRIEDVDISGPVADVPLSVTELPVVGTLSIVIVEL